MTVMDGKKLGICVISRKHGPAALGIAQAAVRAGVEARFFLTGEGVHITQETGFSELLRAARKVAVCEVSYLGAGYKKENIPAMHDKDFKTQMYNAELAETCDRYLVL